MKSYCLARSQAEYNHYEEFEMKTCKNELKARKYVCFLPLNFICINIHRKILAQKLEIKAINVIQNI